MAKINLAARKRARRFALQALYQWYLNEADPQQVLNQFLAQREMESVDIDFFQQLVLGVLNQRSELDTLIQPALEKSVSSLKEVEAIIIKIGVYELKNSIEIPYRVVINEAVELTKTFGATHGHKYVNGVLHTLALQLRPLELEASTRH